MVDQLRQGGFTLYIKVPPVATGQDTSTRGNWVSNCTAQSPQDNGYQQAYAVGNALKKLRIPIHQLRVADHCLSALASVALDLGPPTFVAELAPADQQRAAGRGAGEINQRIRTSIVSGPVATNNLVLLGPAFPPEVSPDPIFSVLRDGETIVFRNGVAPSGTLAVVARVTPGQWEQLVKDDAARGGNPAAPAVASAPAPAAAPTPPVAAPAPQPQPAPMIDPAKELKGIALVRALKGGGYNLYMRHALATTGADQSLPGIPNWWENCALQRNLSDPGRDQAKKVGEALRELGVPLGEVKTSQFCRNKETAKLMGVQSITVTEEINHPVGQRTGGPDVNITRYKHLAMVPKRGTNTLLISHTQGSSKAQERIMSSIAEAEIIVYLPDGKGDAEPVARIPPGDWYLYTTLDWAERATGETTDAWRPRPVRR